MRERVDAYRTPGELGFALQKILALFIDGHTQVSHISLVESNRFLPFLLEAVGERVVALMPNRPAFIEDRYPFLETIDGLEVSSWLKL